MEAAQSIKGNEPHLKGYLDVETIRQSVTTSTRWIAGDSNDVPNGGRLVIDVGDTSVGIFRVVGRLHAYLNVCTHMGGPACQGKILPRVLDVIDEQRQMYGQTWDESDPHVICPWHGFEYSIKTGEHAAIPSIKLHSVSVEEAEGVVYVTL